jgi:pimeloyl-ACP methyl ester carboxylesterase
MDLLQNKKKKPSAAKENKTGHINKKPKNRPGSRILLITCLVYIIMFGLAVKFVMAGEPTETGQLISGQSITASYSSLDLRITAKNSFNSGAVSPVQSLEPIEGVSRQIFSYRVPAAGLIEYGLLVEPQTPLPPGGRPVIILCHGYESPTRYSTVDSYVSDMIFYAQHGYAVYKPDFRGQGLSINQGQADSAYYSMVYNTDLMSLISALKSTKSVDKSDINLWGHSMGSYIALRAAVLSPDIKNLILLSGPVDSLSRMYLAYIPPSDVNNLTALKTRNDLFAKYGTPNENTAFWKYASPINLLPRLKAHTQIHVGSLDQVVPPEFSADLDTALSRQHLKHEYYVYPEGTHSLGPQRYLIWSRSLQLLMPSNAPVTPSA